MKVTETNVPGVVILEPEVYADHRGFLLESFNVRDFQKILPEFRSLQDNDSFSPLAGTLRGIHYQKAPMEQIKIVRAVTGAVFDVAVDLRRDSPTFGKWTGTVLSAENHRQLVIPRGFGHAYCTLTPDVHLLYKYDNYFSAEHYREVYWNDPAVGIDWPVRAPVLSDKDKNAPLLAQADL